MKEKVIIVLGVIAVLFGAVALNEYSKNPLAWCFKDRNVCILEAMQQYRDARDANEEALKKQISDNKNYYDPLINQLKPMLDGATIESELKAGRKENVPSGIISLRDALFPKAYAASGETMNEVSLSVNSGIRFGNVIPVGRYGKVLAEIGSPYASVPVEQYCNKAGIPEKGCDLLLGIAQAESNSGTNFRCNWKSWEEAVKLGQTVYFNPVGRFDGQYYPNGKKIPDENGCYLQKFGSWDKFWEFYTDRMANNIYNFKDREEVYSMYLLYVKGEATPWGSLSQDRKNEVLSTPWVQANNWFVGKVKEANS